MAAYQGLFILQNSEATDLVEVVGSQSFSPVSLVEPAVGLLLTFFLLRKKKADAAIDKFVKKGAANL